VDDQQGPFEMIVRRELSATGKNRVFVNDQLVTASLLKRLAPYWLISMVRASKVRSSILPRI
jgi:DNA repair ATPase RecN